MKIEGLDRLINLPGWSLVGLSFTDNVLFCDLRRDGRMKLTCPKCGKRMSLNRLTQHEIKDLAMGLSINAIALRSDTRKCLW